MRIGFTGTRLGMTVAQRMRFADLLAGVAGELHHGDCVGADTGAHSIACDLGLRIVIHPPDDPKLRAWCRPADRTLAPKPYLQRNRDIVLDTECLIAAPGEAVEQLRSGTWSTVRYARKLGRPIWIINPDGSLNGACGSRLDDLAAIDRPS
jgi:hypothetical protein